MSVYEVEYALSYFDLVLVDGFKDAWKSGNKKMIDAILYVNGMNVADGYEIVDREHRTLARKECPNGKLVYGPRFEGYERLDAEWIKHGAPSMDALIVSTTDTAVRIDLRKMSHQAVNELPTEE